MSSSEDLEFRLVARVGKSLYDDSKAIAAELDMGDAELTREVLKRFFRYHRRLPRLGSPAAEKARFFARKEAEYGDMFRTYPEVDDAPGGSPHAVNEAIATAAREWAELVAKSDQDIRFVIARAPTGEIVTRREKPAAGGAKQDHAALLQSEKATLQAHVPPPKPAKR